MSRLDIFTSWDDFSASHWISLPDKPACEKNIAFEKEKKKKKKKVKLKADNPELVLGSRGQHWKSRSSTPVQSKGVYW